MTMTRYAVVERPGYHGSGDQVSAMEVHDTIQAAARAEKRWGSKRYRVIECADSTRAGDSLGRGHFVDHEPTMIEGQSGAAIPW